MTPDPAKLRDLAQRYTAAWCSQDAASVAAFYSPNGAVYHWTLIGTNTGLGGTGQRVRISGFEVWKIGVDGLIAESRGTFDRGAYQRQFEHGFEGSQ